MLLDGLKDENAAYVMTQRSPSGPGAAAVVVDRVRLFRRLPDALWSYRVHEQILPALRRTGVDLRRSDVVIQHTGHEDAGLGRRGWIATFGCCCSRTRSAPTTPSRCSTWVRSTTRSTGRPRRCPCCGGACNVPGRAIPSCPIGDLYLKQCRWDDLEAAAKGVANCPGGDVKADALRSRGLEARRMLASACAATLDTPAVTTNLCVGERNVPPAARPRVSLCMIVKDEEANLAECLAAVAGVVDEMIVVDTGSSDHTCEVAAKGGARVVDFAWVDDFAAARNESINHATADWIFWLDADERLDPANREKLRNLFAVLSWENAAYLMQQLSATEDPHGSRVAVDQVRLFRRDPALRWEYRVHEQIMLAIRRAGHDMRRTDIVITHGGYEALGAAERKLQRNVELLLRQDAERPDDPITLYHLGQVYQQLGRPAQALPVLRRSLERLPPDYSIRPRLFVSIARAHEALGQRAEAMAVTRAGRGQYPDAVELLFLEAARLYEKGDLARAEERLLHLLSMPPDRQLTTGDIGRQGYKARHLLAEVYRGQGRVAEAERNGARSSRSTLGSCPPGMSLAVSISPRGSGASWRRWRPA